VAELRIAVRVMGSSAERVKAYLDALNGRVLRLESKDSLPPQSESKKAPPTARMLPVWPAAAHRAGGNQPKP
jgi:hypothetical protein